MIQLCISLSAEDPKWTEVVSAIASCFAVLGAIAAFATLFKKDKNKQEQLNRLADIAGKFDAQNSIMQEGNTMLREQVEVMRSMLINQTEMSADTNKLAEIQEKQHKLNLRPYLRAIPNMTMGNTFKIKIQNIGNKGTITRIEKDNNNIKIIQPSLPFSFYENQNFELIGSSNLPGHEITYQFIIYFEDSIGTKYSQILKGKGAEATFENPEEIKFES